MVMVHVNLEVDVYRSFRVDQVAGLFDVSLAEKSRLEMNVPVPAADDESFADWRIGAVVGPSGSCKSVVSSHAYGKSFVMGYSWPRDKAVVDGFAKSLSMQVISETLTAVGFSSPPAWVLPYHVLSNGQRFRCDLARALLTPGPDGLVAFDEFTSVVDRQVGQFASSAIAKAVRKDKFPTKRFVAVTCHYDVLEWLEPDWILDMSKRELARGCLQRPSIELEISRINRDLWPVFAPHHYLSHRLHHTARCYGAIWRGQVIAFCATIQNAGHTGRRIVHRLVVLPDYQGMGIGLRLLEAVAEHETAAGKLISIRTSHPSLIAALRHRRSWQTREISASGRPHHGSAVGSRRGAFGRATAAFRWCGF